MHEHYQPAIELHDVTKCYTTSGEEQVIFQQLNHSFPKGLKTTILGPSGCGKTTLLNLIGGIDPDFDGDLLFNGVPIEDFDAYRRQNVSFIFQDLNLIMHHNLIKNITIGLTNDVEDKEKRALELLEQVGLLDHANKLPHQLSGGEKQRVAIARALARNTDILLCDEPTGSLDEDTEQEIIQLISDVFSGKTIVMITHNEELAASFSDVILTIENETLVEISRKNTPPLQVVPPTDSPETQKKTFHRRFEINLLTRKLSLLNASYLIIIISAIFIFGLGIIQGVEKEIDRILYKKHQVDQIYVSTHRFSLPGFNEFIDDYNEISDYDIMGVMTSVEIESQFSIANVYSRNTLNSIQPSFQENIKNNIVYGRLPQTNTEILYSHGAAIKKLYDYYGPPMETVGEIKVLMKWLLSLSSKQLLYELNAIDIYYRNAYKYNEDRAYDKELTVVGIVDDYRYVNREKIDIRFSMDGAVHRLTLNNNIYMMEEEFLEYINTVYLGYRSVRFTNYRLFIEEEDLDLRFEAYASLLLHKFHVYGDDPISEERALYYRDVYGYKVAILGACALLSIFAIISIYNGIKSNVDWHKSNIGIFKSLGYTTQNIQSMFLKEGLVITAIITAMTLLIWFALNAIMNSTIIESLDPRNIIQMETITHLNAYSVLAIVFMIMYIILGSIRRELRKVNIVNLIRSK